jgi:lipoprotein-releasing system ATP-binding protein
VAAAGAIISAAGLEREFPAPGGTLRILRGLDLDVGPGESVAIIGASGCGKSTLLHILGCLDRPTRGRLAIAGRDVSALPPSQLAAIRNSTVGFIFQFHHLLPEFTAAENAAMPLLIAGEPLAAALERGAALLERVGLAERARHRPAELSGGEQQRVAIARALANGPRAVLADEPTGNLDRQSGQAVADLLWDLNRSLGMAMVVVTHNPAVAARADRTLELKDGKLWAMAPGA